MRFVHLLKPPLFISGSECANMAMFNVCAKRQDMRATELTLKQLPPCNHYGSAQHYLILWRMTFVLIHI
jgi:hypothetical protein